MSNYPSEAGARVALHEVERARHRVIDQIGMPGWYWWGLAGCWVLLGVLSDVAAPWITVAATVTFGAVHSAVSPLPTGRTSRSSATSSDFLTRRSRSSYRPSKKPGM